MRAPISSMRHTAFSAEIVLKVQSPSEAELPLLKSGGVLIGMLDPFNTDNTAPLALRRASPRSRSKPRHARRARKVSTCCRRKRTSPGYKAVLVACSMYQRFMPMLMTAAGTVKAARVLVLGAGVAGLQAIATAKRLGAVVEASDVRPAVQGADRIARREVRRRALRNR